VEGNKTSVTPFLKLTIGKISLLATLFVLLLYLFTIQSTLMRNLEAKTLDLRFHLREKKNPNTPIVLVLIDDQSIAALGRWPWSRSRFAELVRRLKAAGAKVIALDLLFIEPEVNPVRDTLQSVRSLLESIQLPQLDVFRQKLLELEETTDPDRQFATALSEAGNVLLPFSFVFASAENLSPSLNPPPDFVSGSAYRAVHHRGSATPYLPLVAVKILYPLAQLGEQAVALGHVNVAFDTDGTPRYDYPVVQYQGEYYPSLALQIARLYLGFTPEEMQIHFGEGIQLGNLFIPTDESMRMLVNYYGPRGTFPSISAVDVLQDRFPDSTFRDKIVLIGAAAIGLGDTFGTPFSTALPGVERHANLTATILQNDFLVQPHSPVLIDLFCIALIAFLLGGLSPKLPSFWGNIFALSLGGLFVGLNVLTFVRAGLWIGLFFPLLAIGLNQIALTAYRLLTEERQKRTIRRAFQYYLHPAVIDQVAQNPQLLTLGGEEKELTVLFSDIRRFSAISERLCPQELVKLLNEYLTTMTQLVLDNSGLLDKYIGDAIMAVYGAPLPMDDHAYHACHTALQMMTALRSLQKRWEEKGFPVIDIGIGINTGRMVVGNMGSAIRFDYTVIGDEVNLGSRLEGVNKEFGTHIIISESTWEQVSERLVTRELDIIQVKGKTKPTRIFEVLGFPPMTPQQIAMVRLFSEGLQAYRAQQWNQALHCFEQVLQRVPGDRPSQLYIHRCLACKANPPPPDWDSVYTMQMK
jgi:adenylate cyclase